MNRVTAAQNRGGVREGWQGTRVDRTVHVEDREVALPGGSTRTIKLFSRGGAVGIVEFSEAGEGSFAPLRRRRIHRNKAKNGLFAWYQDYVLPEPMGEARSP